MLPFSTLIIPDKKNGIAVYLQIANRIVNLIREGIIKPGAALPGSREMSKLLKVHRKTIVAAYEELFAQDWIETIPRKGVFVAQHLPEIKPRTSKTNVVEPHFGDKTAFSFSPRLQYPVPGVRRDQQRLIINDGFPDVRVAPVAEIFREIRSLIRGQQMHDILQRLDAAGNPRFREAMAGFLNTTRGLNIQPENILITRGAQMSIYLAAQLLVQPGDAVIVGEPNYFMANMIFEQAGALLIKVPVDEYGMDIDAVENICKKKKVRAIYVIPHHHHPTTVTMSGDRRMQLLQLTHRHRLALIEDDYDYSYHYDSAPLLPLASTQHGGSVIYIGSVTKLLIPSMRIGFMVGAANFIAAAVNLRKLVDTRGDDYLELAIAGMIENGHLARHIKKSNKLYHQRRDLFCEMIDHYLRDVIRYRKPSGGMAIWATFNPRFPLTEVAKRASAKGLYMNDGSFYSAGGKSYNALRMGFSSLNEDEMEQAVHILVNATKK